MTMSMDQQTEGPVARAIEKQTSRLPSDLFLWTGGVAVLASAALMLAGKKTAANFVGQWVPTVLLLGLYNKLVKVAGHDVQEPQIH